VNAPALEVFGRQAAKDVRNLATDQLDEPQFVFDIALGAGEPRHHSSGSAGAKVGKAVRAR
jgi:hypothetical protein